MYLPNLTNSETLPSFASFNITESSSMAPNLTFHSLEPSRCMTLAADGGGVAIAMVLDA